MLKVGVVGCGHLGKIHIKLLNQSESFDLLGVYDNDFNISKKAAHESGCKSYESFEKMIEEIDVLDIVTPTPSHYGYALKAIEKGVHVFIEKPVCSLSLIHISEPTRR